MMAQAVASQCRDQLHRRRAAAFRAPDDELGADGRLARMMRGASHAVQLLEQTERTIGRPVSAQRSYRLAVLDGHESPAQFVELIGDDLLVVVGTRRLPPQLLTIDFIAQ